MCMNLKSKTNNGLTTNNDKKTIFYFIFFNLVVEILILDKPWNKRNYLEKQKLKKKHNKKIDKNRYKKRGRK